MSDPVTRPTPICHRIMAAMYAGSPPDAAWPDLPAMGTFASCIGPRCAMWLDSAPGVTVTLDGEKMPRTGCCADNPDAEPWPDPNEKE